jgi:multiple sugar transport system ATP-binding protein
MVFQSYAVFPHMSVLENIAFGLRMARIVDAEVRRRAQEGAVLLQIDHLLDRYPAHLSGGQRQRVAVARAIVMRPQVLLMDEPLSNLDALLRLQMRAELKRLHHEVRSTTIYVTHDQVEALSLGDRIAVMREGKVVQCDGPDQIYDRPANQFVGSFIGNPPMNFLTARAGSSNGRRTVYVAGVRLLLPEAAARGSWVDGDVLVGIRPEQIAVGFEPAPQALPGRVVVLEPIGPQKLLTAQIGDQTVKVAAPAEFSAGPGAQVWLRFDPARLRFMDPRTGDAIG